MPPGRWRQHEQSCEGVRVYVEGIALLTYLRITSRWAMTTSKDSITGVYVTASHSKTVHANVDVHLLTSNIHDFFDEPALLLAVGVREVLVFRRELSERVRAEEDAGLDRADFVVPTLVVDGFGILHMW
jgi:hypothetical protein